MRLHIPKGLIEELSLSSFVTLHWQPLKRFVFAWTIITPGEYALFGCERAITLMITSKPPKPTLLGKDLT